MGGIRVSTSPLNPLAKEAVFLDSFAPKSAFGGCDSDKTGVDLISVLISSFFLSV